jgi:hypothetical protein
MKRLLCILVLVVSLAGLLKACGGGNGTAPPGDTTGVWDSSTWDSSTWGP